MLQDYINYIMDMAVKLLQIPSPTGYTMEVSDFIYNEYVKMGYSPKKTVKGDVIVCLNEESNDDALLLQSHMDTLGAVVKEIKSNGRLELLPLATHPHNIEGENCIVATRWGNRYEGTFQLNNASLHVNLDYDKVERRYKNMEVVLDEFTSTKEETQELGILPGDFICFDTKTCITKQGFIKSRYLDDKFSVAILMGYAKYYKEKKPRIYKKVYQHITAYEEVGHGGASIPSDVIEILCVDMGCIGEGLSCDETMVSICAKDSLGPYNYEMVSRLIKLAKENKLKYAVDVYPHYASDAETALVAGNDVRHALIGPGVYASHGCERGHRKGAENTFLLIKEYCESKEE